MTSFENDTGRDSCPLTTAGEQNNTRTARVALIIGFFPIAASANVTVIRILPDPHDPFGLRWCIAVLKCGGSHVSPRLRNYEPAAWLAESFRQEHIAKPL
jgi:hypothetical protein